MILDLEGQKDLSKLVQTSDIPTSENKAYLSPVEVFGFVGEKLGRAFDPVLVSREETANQDVAATIPKSYLSLIAFAVVAFIVYSIVRK